MFERTNHMPRNMVIGKLSTRLDRQVEIPSTLFELGSHVATCECRSGHDPATNRGVGLCTRGGGPVHNPGRKGRSCVDAPWGPMRVS